MNNSPSLIYLITGIMSAGLVSMAICPDSGNAGQQDKVLHNTDSMKSDNTSKTFQELGFFGKVRKDKWDRFLVAVQNNIAHSRKEPGNLTFSLYKPVGHGQEVIWFERFENKAAHNAHKEQPYFKDAIAVIQESLAGQAHATTLDELDEIPVTSPAISDAQQSAYQAICLFSVKPEKRPAFIQALAEVTRMSRQAAGNLEFNIYQFADNPNQFALIEGWQSPADLRNQLEQGYIDRLHKKGFFISNPLDTRWLVEDISQ